MNPLARAIMAVAGASAPPLTLPTTGLLAAWDARVGVTNVSGACSAWADQSGNGWHASQGTAGNRPSISTADGYASLLFNGTNSSLQVPSITATAGVRTVYAVIKPTTLRGLFDTQTGRLFVGATGDLHRIYDTGLRDTGVSVSTSRQRVAYEINGGTFTLRRNGTSLASIACGANTSVGGAVRIGSDYTGAAVTNGHILFLAVYNAAHNTAVESYITQEWGV